MGDTISRQAAILIASGYCHPANIAKELAQLPSAQPEWIPCSESMPESFGEVLVTFMPTVDRFSKLWTRVIIAHYSNLMGIARDCFWIGEPGKSSFEDITPKVTAWMPLPEPYKEERDADGLY